MNNLLWLIRREIWENRSLWIAPLALAGVILVTAAFGGIHIGDNDVPWMGFGAQDAHSEEIRSALAATPLDKKQMIYAMTISMFTVVQLLIMSIVVFFYLLDSLLAERKDRSILFWKSLPVSDGEVVASKLLTAVVATPLFVLAVSAVLQLLVGGVLWLRFHASMFGDVLMPFDAGTWFSVQLSFLVFIAAAMLWYLPLFAYLMLVSVWARRNAFLWALLPPLSILLVEGLINQSHHFANFLGRRLGGVFDLFDFSSGAFGRHGSSDSLPPLGEVLAAISNAFTSYETWLGVLAAAAMIFVTVRVRRFRDDS